MESPLDAVVESMLSVAVGINHLFSAVFLCHVGEAAVPFQDACGRVVEEHDEAGIEAI